MVVIHSSVVTLKQRFARDVGQYKKFGVESRETLSNAPGLVDELMNVSHKILENESLSTDEHKEESVYDK